MLFVGALQRIGDWFSQGRGAMFAGQREHALDLLRRYQGPGCVVNRDKRGVCLHASQSRPDRILPIFPAGQNATNLVEIVLPNEFLEFPDALGPRHQDNFAHR
jgi:hypothetical protein